jgi:hypothetical protein
MTLEHKKYKTYSELRTKGASPAECTAWIESASKEELLEVIKSNADASHVPDYKLAEKLLLVRLAEPQPHWTVTPAFWVGVVAMVFAAIALWIAAKH